MLKVYCARFDTDDEEGDECRGFNDEGGKQLYEGGLQLHEGHDDVVI